MRIAKIRISSVSDDFAPGISDVRWQSDGRYIDLVSNYGGRETKESVRLDQIHHLEKWSDDEGYNTARAVGLGLAGNAVLGDVGLIAGILLGGRKKEVTFKATLIDGRSFVATADVKAHRKLHGAVYK